MHITLYFISLLHSPPPFTKFFIPTEPSLFPYNGNIKYCNGNIKYLKGKSIFAVNLPLKLSPATVINADIESLKSLYTLFGKYLDHMLVKFEQNFMVQTTRNFELFTKKKGFFKNNSWQSVDTILEVVSVAETIEDCSGRSTQVPFWRKWVIDSFEVVIGQKIFWQNCGRFGPFPVRVTQRSSGSQNFKMLQMGFSCKSNYSWGYKDHKKI